MDLQQRAISYLKDEMSDTERILFEEELAGSSELRAELESGREVLDLLEAANEESNVRRSYSIIQEAIKHGASDIHLLPGTTDDMHEGPRASRVVYRIDGQLHEMATIPPEFHRPTIDHWKKMAECNLAERLPQDGRISVRVEGENYELQVNFLPTISGERMTARLVARPSILLGLNRLGLTSVHQEMLLRLIERPYGFIITSGYVNAGRTTLIYALLNALLTQGTRARNILTVENPVEYKMAGLSQIAVNRSIGLTYAAILRGLKRADPDVIFSAEFRDLETLELATEAALTSCLVFGQLHVSSALLIPQRMREMGLVSHLSAQTLGGAIGQRLVRRICTQCSAEYDPSRESLQRLGLSLAEDGPFRRGKGCDVCHNTGYKGRIGLYEIWEVEDDARKIIAENAPVDTLWQATFGRTGGSLWDDGRAKIKQGITTVEEVTWALFDYPITTAKAKEWQVES